MIKMTTIEAQKNKLVEKLAIFCLEKISISENVQLILKQRNHNEIINILSAFLKETFGEDFYNSFMNNLYQSEEVKLYIKKGEIEYLEFQIEKLKNQRKETSKELKKQKRRLFHLQNNDINESYTLAPTNETESLICLDIQENFSDAFIILHEGIHRMYLETNHPNYTLDELPSTIMEWLFYQYCMKKEELKEEAKLFFQKNLQIISTISKDYLINRLLKKLYISNMEMTEANIWNEILKIKNLKIRQILKKELEEFLWYFTLPDAMMHLDDTLNANYLQAYYYGYFLVSQKDMNVLTSITKEVYYDEISLQRKIIKSLKEEEILQQYGQELKRIQEK